MKFSEKYGFSPVRRIVQSTDIDTPLRNGLWNVLYEIYFAQLSKTSRFTQVDGIQGFVIKALWKDFFKLPVDDIPYDSSSVLEFLKAKFYDAPWYGVYDVIQFCYQLFPASDAKKEFNRILERELSAYRFVDDEIAPITSEHEIVEIEKALIANDPSGTHLNTALELLSRKESPDYRNSIKESISAVEAICGNIAGKPKATLGDALEAIKKSGIIALHPALNNAFDKLYGYTSNADGIRHALLDETNLHQEDAVFMLVACSAFVNYLKAKVSRTDR